MPPDTKPLRILCIVAIIDILGFGILIPLVPYMAEQFGAEPRTITWIMGSYSLFQLIAAPIWGRLSDRYGRRPILISSLAGACISYLILCFAQNIEWLLASRMLAGFMAGNLAAAFAYASDVSKPEDRAKSLGMVGAAIGIGFMLGPAIGGALAGDNEQTANFTLPALVAAFLSVVAIVLVKVALPESHPQHERTLARERPALSTLQLFVQRPPLRFIAGAALLVTTAQGILESIFAIWALHKFGFGPRTVGLMLFGLAVVAVSMQGGFVRVLVPKLGERRLAALGIVAYVTGLFIVAEAGLSLPLTILGFALCGVGAGAFNPTASALASKQSGPSDRGAVMGTYQASTSLARVIGPFISGPIYAMFGPDAPFFAGACIMIPALWLIWHSQKAVTAFEQRA
jgi:MFS transporter, DHA1 family, tetracycline resistance protein